jgi:hypothetical protein
MNYQPFSELTTGTLFRDVEHRAMLLMKSSDKKHGTLMESIWLDNTLMPRGMLIEYHNNECVIEVTEDDVLLPARRKDPIDPRRKFWKEGDTQTVGRDCAAKIEVFAGLFLYSGFGQGTYYASTDNEQFWCGADEAREKADAEGVLLVKYDSKDWTNDPKLTFEKKEARRRKDEAAARVAALPPAADAAS